MCLSRCLVYDVKLIFTFDVLLVLFKLGEVWSERAPMLRRRDCPDIYNPKRRDRCNNRAAWVPLHIKQSLLGPFEHANEGPFLAIPHVDVMLRLLSGPSNNIVAPMRECSALPMVQIDHVLELVLNNVPFSAVNTDCPVLRVDHISIARTTERNRLDTALIPRGYGHRLDELKRLCFENHDLPPRSPSVYALATSRKNSKDAFESVRTRLRACCGGRCTTATLLVGKREWYSGRLTIHLPFSSHQYGR
mmetsp:Transcript_11732/g.30138  ORF Transcript_11732/g.30138 Transcript_11732/m.30138 type:complete len:248 (-) Transcript_11732:197-940(-)